MDEAVARAARRRSRRERIKVPGASALPCSLLAGPIRIYQRIAAGRHSPCRFEPSCSSYALDALAAHGAGRGGWLALRRILRCHPWGGHGWDPVPVPCPGGASNPPAKVL